LTEPLDAATSDFTAAFAPGLKATITRVVSGAAADTLPANAIASAAAQAPRTGTIFDARVCF
jgi:hypothetical protein